MTLALIALVISGATGWLALDLLWPRGMRGASTIVLRGTVAFGLGLLLSSIVTLACLAIGIADRTAIISTDLFLLAALGWLAFERSPAEQASAEARSFGRLHGTDWILALALVSAIAVHLRLALARFLTEPLGFWDAFAIWNLKARFFFLEGGAHWQRAFSDAILWSHTDYPLLLPLNVARLWVYAGDAPQSIPALLSGVFVVLLLALLLGGVASVSGGRPACLAALALLATPGLMQQAVWQVADIPLAFFLAASLALILVAGRFARPNPRLLALAGLLAGTAAWTKNEGLLFGLAIAAAIALLGGGAEARDRFANTLQFIKGFAGVVVMVLAVKLAVGGESDLASDFTFASLGRIFELARHQLIVESFAHSALLLAGAPLLVVLAGLAAWRGAGGDARGSLTVAALALTLQLVGYYLVYLLTERDLAWHLGTSNLRLFVQLWPSVLLLLFAKLRPFGRVEPASAETEAQASSRFA